MSTVQQAIEVSAPLHAVYEQLADLENYPQFMSGVEEVVQVSDDRTHWIMDLDGERREFDAQLIECSVDQRVAWRSTDGPTLAETITLRPMGETRTQVVAQLEADVAALMPSDRHAQETLTRRLKADLASFKALIEHDAAFMTGMPGAAGMTMPTMSSGSAMTGMRAADRGGSRMAGGMGGLGDTFNSPKAVADRIARSRAQDAAHNGSMHEKERGSLDF
jgi:carbon monoxide dehydrogenase subunit G